MKPIFVTGGTGFLGGHLVGRLTQSAGEVRVLTRSARTGPETGADGLRLVRGDIDVIESFRSELGGVDTLIHLAYPANWVLDRHLCAVKGLARAAREAGVRRVILCSTAIVAGRARSVRITEETPCEPVTGYERVKLEIERTLTDEARDTFELAILRPTAVFGPGSENLCKMAASLLRDGAWSRFVRSSVFGRRNLNLVCVGNVVAALMFLAARRQAQPVETYLISDDHDPINNYRDVERLLAAHLGRGAITLPRLPVPPIVLSLLLRATGRSSVDPFRVYDMSRLRRAGFEPPVSVSEGLREFASWYRESHEAALR